MSHYSSYKNADLKLMLKQRGLRISGVKGTLVSRLTDYDIEHPFRFLNLPGEIRNEIYKYVAADAEPHAPPRKNKKSHRVLPNHTAETGEKANRASTSPPALFLTCSQIRSESRGIFYRYHTFTLHHIWVEEKKGLLSRTFWWSPSLRRKKNCLQRVTRWLDAIGAEARKEIRSLEVEVHCDDSTTVKNLTAFVDDFHAKLSDEATVVYRAVSYAEYDTMALWDLGNVFYGRDSTHVPLLEHPEWTASGDDANIWLWTDIQVQHLPNRKSGPRPSLTFGPGLGWFGNQP